jgi:ribosomal protein S18 acetylase RimI-like enzyme
MTTASGTPDLTHGLPEEGGRGDPAAGCGWPIMVVPADLHLQAAARLVGDASGGDPTLAAQRFLQSAGALGVDLSLMWCTLDAAPRRVRQVSLAVIGSGRTAMLFVSGPERRSRGVAGLGFGSKARTHAPGYGHAERVALIRHACVQAAVPGPVTGMGVRLAQALLEAKETDAARAYRDAGFTQLGDLAYMRRPLRRGAALPEVGPWPEGLRVESIRDLAKAGVPSAEIDARLLAALEGSYVQTRDCPELCGLRDASDVLESHRNVGVYDPALWWIVSDAEGPQGCMLLTVCPEQDSVELVYVGLSPKVRGKGLGHNLMALGLKAIHEQVLTAGRPAGPPHIAGGGGLTCAVDTRNEPAMRLYRRLGFERFGVRIPFVRGLSAGAAGL